MTRAIASELFKLRSTRSFWWLSGVTLALVLGFTILFALVVSAADTRLIEGLMWSMGTLVQSLALLLGVLVVTTEFRHGTITPTLLVIPNRLKLMGGKVSAGLLTGGALGLITAVVITLIVLGVGSVRDIDTSGDKFAMIVGGTLTTALFAVLGVGIGAVIRNQLGAAIAAIGYVFAELPVSLVLLLFDSTDDIMQRWSLGAVSNSLWAVNPSDTDQLDQVPGGLLLLLYVTIILVAGVILMQRRDVTA